MANVFVEESTMRAIGDAIREKTGGSTGILPVDMPIAIQNITSGNGDYQEGFEAGKEQGAQDWFDQFQNGTETSVSNDFLYAFGGPRWRDRLYKPTRPMLNLVRTTAMYAYSGITDTKVPIGIVAGRTTNCGSTFQNATSLVTINEFIVHDTLGMTSQFAGCSKLVSLKVTGTIGKALSVADCKVLSKTSIENLIGCLSDTTSNLTATFNTAAVNKAFETSTAANDGTTSDEWLALVASKPNWSFVV